MNDETVRIVRQGIEQQIEGLSMLFTGREVPRQRQSCTPVLRVAGNEPLTEIDESPRCADGAIRALEPLEGEIRPLRHVVHQLFPRLDGAGEVALPLTDVTEIQMGRRDCRVEIDDVLVRLCRASEVAGGGLDRPHLVSQKAENLVVLLVPAVIDFRNLLANARGLGPLLLIFVQLLQVDERVPVQPVETNHLLKRLEGAIDEAAVTEVQAEAEQHVPACSSVLRSVRCRSA